MTKSTVKPALKRIEEKLDTLMKTDVIGQKSETKTISDKNVNPVCDCKVTEKENPAEVDQPGAKSDE